MYSFFINIIGWFLLYGFALHMLLTNMGNLFLNKLIALLMLARGSQSLYFILVASGQTAALMHLFKCFNFFYFAAPVCSFLYFKGFLKEETRLKKWEVLHFLPLLLPLADLIAWYRLSAAARQTAVMELQSNHTIFIKSSVGLFSNHMSLLFCTVMFLVYLLISGRMLLKAGVLKNRRENVVANNWLIYLYVFLLSVQLVRLIPFISKYLLGFDHLEGLVYNYYVNFLSIILIGAVVYALYHPKILYGYAFLSEDFNALKQTPVLTFQSEKIKTAPSALVLKNEKLYTDRILEYMEEKKPYLNPDFSINLLAHEMNIPIHHCSYVVNYIIGKNFREWVNGYRIAHFIQEYPLQIKNKTILTLSAECGFKNKNTFYSSFKQAMGVAPSEYF